MPPAINEVEWPSSIWGRVACTAGIFAVATMLADRSTACASVLAPLCVNTARAIAQILNWLGMSAEREMATLVHRGGFGYEIGFACTGIIPAGLLASAILAAAGRLRARSWGAVLGAVTILLLNVVRLVSLFYIGVLAPKLFWIAHSIVWQGLTVVFGVGFFYVWKRQLLAAGQQSPCRLHPTVCSIRG